MVPWAYPSQLLNGIMIGLGIFAGLTVVTDKLTISCISLVLWCSLQM